MSTLLAISPVAKISPPEAIAIALAPGTEDEDDSLNFVADGV